MTREELGCERMRSRDRGATGADVEGMEALATDRQKHEQRARCTRIGCKFDETGKLKTVTTCTSTPVVISTWNRISSNHPSLNIILSFPEYIQPQYILVHPSIPCVTLSIGFELLFFVSRRVAWRHNKYEAPRPIS